MVDVVQLVRASDCGSECRGFESHRSPKEIPCNIPLRGIFCLPLVVLCQTEYCYETKEAIV